MSEKEIKKIMDRIDVCIDILNEYHPLSEADPDYPEHEFSDAIKGIIEATDTLNDDLIQAHKQAAKITIIKEMI